MQRKTAILLGVYAALCLLALAVYHLIAGPADGMGFYVLFIVAVLPVASFLLSFLLGLNDCGGVRKLMFAIYFGVMYMLVHYLTFVLTNILKHHEMAAPEWNLGTKGILISLVGLVIGDWLRKSGIWSKAVK